ncbi:SGNH/GDSL hydrolase family protein [Knoellia subterranea]|uniref:SGNH hydrolase-type esterase domain-containing protein n=1 Tax=Knoellia subterranea KCTC 19937 TaxID=1385521 RepID=A0A0A0JI13_9MICO|nr:SGNH/GDSL hydrolase family protein [Knoellia subterranea]KGN35697.1 hypothetical protein N803_06400 [Knoellia subterranea KCTC 19937]
MKRFRGTDVGLGVLAIAVNVALVVALVVWVSGRNDEPPLPTGASPTPTASKSTSASASPSPTPSTAAAAILARTTPVTLAVLGDQTSDGKSEWVANFAELLGRTRQVTLHQLDPQDPTIYAADQTFGTEGPEVTIYNGSRAEAQADYAAKRLSFLAPRKPDLVVLNYGRNDSASQIRGRLDRTLAAARKAWPETLVVATLQAPTADDGDQDVREQLAEWADENGVPTLDVAQEFLDTGEPNAYVSTRDRTAMSGQGDRLWGRTAYRLLVGTEPPEVETTEPSATPSETTEAATQPSATPRQTSRPRTTTPPETTTQPTSTPDPEETPSFTRRPTPTIFPTVTLPPEPGTDEPQGSDPTPVG